MAPEWCPKCNDVRNMRVTVSQRTIAGSDGAPVTIKTNTLHCEVCNMFARSEDVKERETEHDSRDGFDLHS